MRRAQGKAVARKLPDRGRGTAKRGHGWSFLHGGGRGAAGRGRGTPGEAPGRGRGTAGRSHGRSVVHSGGGCARDGARRVAEEDALAAG